MRPFDGPNFTSDVRHHELLLSLLDFVSFRCDPFTVLPELARAIQSALPFELATLSLFDPVRGVIKIFRWNGADWLDEPAEADASDTASGSVWRSQSSLLFDNLATAHRFEPELNRLRQRTLLSYCVLPLTTTREKLGAMGFGSLRTSAFGQSELHYLEQVAAILNLCFDSALTQTDFADEQSRLRLFFEISSPPVEASDLNRSVSSILGSLQKWDAGDQFGLYLYDKETRSLRLHMADPGFAEKMSRSGTAPIEGSLAGRIFRTGRGVVLDYPALSRISLDSVKRGIELGVRCLCLAPIPAQNGVLGVLKVARRHEEPFSPHEVDVIEQVAATVGPSLEREIQWEAPNQESAADSLLDMAKTVVAGGPVIQIGRLQVNRGFSAPEPTGSIRPPWFGAPDALLESEQLLSEYFKASQVGLCILDADYRYLALNGTMAEMHGASALFHLGKTVREVLGDFAELVEANLNTIFATGNPVLNLEISFTLPTRTEPGHWIEHYIPIKNAVGQVVQLGVIAIEITEQKKLEESLRDVSETLRQERRRQEILVELACFLATEPDIRKSFPQISAYLRRIFRQEYAALFLREEKSGKLMRQALDFPLRKGPVPNIEIDPFEPWRGKTASQAVPFILTGEQIQAFPPITDHYLTEGLKSLCCVPLMRSNRPLGLLVLGSTRINAFKTEDLTVLTQVAPPLAIALENLFTAHEIEMLKDRLGKERAYLQEKIEPRRDFEEMIGESPSLARVEDQIAMVAESQATVLLLGETGTGKGLAARALHRRSARHKKPFVVLNCAAIPTGLLESELFGHEKGAFTGAVNQKVGRLELANEGTLFLDEIAEISPELQPKLLRVLQDHEFERLGGIKTIRVDIRLVAATNRDLARSVAAKEFRADLFYRLNVFPIRLPALRERRDDIPLLVRHFVQKHASKLGRVIETVPTDAMEALVNWGWPGNVRELENIIERSVILSAGTALSVPVNELFAGESEGPDRSLEDAEREHIIQVLRETRGIISGSDGAAARLGVKRTTLQSKMERLGINRVDYSDNGAA